MERIELKDNSIFELNNNQIIITYPDNLIAEKTFKEFQRNFTALRQVKK